MSTYNVAPHVSWGLVMRFVKFLAAACILILANFFPSAYAADVHQMTNQPSYGRYQVVQSQLAAKWTFRLDRNTGRVWQLVKTKDDQPAWQTTVVFDPPKISNPTKPRFVIFTSGLAARHTFLMDSFTGKTWQLFQDTSLNMVGWQPFQP